ncbi:peptidase inhibitor family I36 protein [Nocardioides sp. R1-1]|uniref:peptidase inhibitor family I36 protein n=1 Tax=Nocardioides sp. R1-1 TaxID=3383502 RepID=UPI0038D10597
MTYWRSLIATTAVATTMAISGLLASGAGAVELERSNGEVARLLSAELERHPGGVVRGNEIRYSTGETFVAVEAGTFSLSQCTSGRFCGWAQSNYSGSFYYTTGTGVTKTLSWTARSYSNNRAQGARLYDSTGSSSVCFTPGQDRATIGSSYYSPDKVFLSSTASC